MKVALIMGSKSDLPVALKAMEMLDKFGVPYSARVISAHRALDMLTKCVNSFEKDAVKVVIALAGKAAHLPGVIAGMTTCRLSACPSKARLSWVWTLCSPSCRCPPAFPWQPWR